MRASTRSHQKYTTTSDASGAYALDVTDDVFIEFVDASEPVGAACFARIPSASRVATIDVILGRPRDLAGVDLGCQIPASLDAQKSTWVGRPRFLDQDIAGEMFGPDPAATPDVRLDLAVTDLKAAQMTREGAAVLFTPAAVQTVSSFLNKNLGKTIVIALGGVRAIRFTVVAEFPPDRDVPFGIVASALTPEERRSLCELLTNMKR